MASQWFYKREGEKFGPVSTEQLKSLAAAMRISPADLIWKDGMAEWASAGRLKGLFPGQVADQAASVSTRPSEAPQADGSAPGALGNVAAEPTGRATFGDRLKAAGTLAAMRAKLVSLTLPNAYRKLGRHLETTDAFKSDFSALFDQFTELRVKMSSLAAMAAGQPSAVGFKAKVTATAFAAKEMADRKGLEHRIGQVLGELGQTAYAKHGEQSGPPEIVRAITQTRCQISGLDAAIAGLSRSKPGQLFTPPRSATGLITIIVLGMLAFAAFHHTTKEKPIASAQESVIVGATPFVTKSSGAAQASEAKPISVSRNHVAQQPRSTDDTHQGEVTGLSYDLNPATAYQQVDLLQQHLRSAADVFDFVVIGRVDENLYEISLVTVMSGSSEDHWLLKTMFTQFTSSGRAQMALEYEGSQTMHMVNGFDKEMAVYREAVSEGGVRPLSISETYTNRQTIEKQISTARQILFASILQSKFTGDRNQQVAFAHLVGLEYPDLRKSGSTQRDVYKAAVIDGCLASYLSCTKGMSLQEYAKSTKDVKLVDAVKSLQDR